MGCGCALDGGACGPHVTLRLVRGDAFHRILRFVDPDTGAPVDIAGQTFTGEIRAYPGSPDLVASIPLTPAIPSTLGEVGLDLTEAETLAIAAGAYVYDIKRDPDRATIFHGDVPVDESVTQ